MPDHKSPTFAMRSVMFFRVNVPERIASVGDLWAGMLRKGRSLKAPIEKLQRLRK